MDKPGKLLRDDGQTLAFLRHDPALPAGSTGILWLGGFKSDMTGTKASAVHEWALGASRSFLRFDYFAHGLSSGDFEQGTISRWRADALVALDQLTQGPQILVGSSMGGWLALLVALARPDRIKGLILIAPAPDFTQELMWKGFSAEIQNEIMTRGHYLRPSEYGEAPYAITRGLIEDGRAHLLLDAPININLPVCILQGMADADVPWRHAARLVEALTSRDVTLHLSKDGDHRLSTPQDIERLTQEIEKLLCRIEA